MARPIPDLDPIDADELAADDQFIVDDTSAQETKRISKEELASALATPSGIVSPYAGINAPDGWLMCYGQTISRSVYAALFAALGTTYGAGDGTTTLALPDMRGRVVAGQDDMGGSSANRLTGLAGGVNGDNLAATGGSESHTLSTTEMPAHVHSYGPTGSSGGFGIVDSGAASSSGLRNTGSNGSGGAHNNVQPTIILNYIIKT